MPRRKMGRFRTSTYLDRRRTITVSTKISKDEAHKLVDQLPAEATWEDLMREIYVREAIEKGLDDSNSGRTKDVTEVRKKYGLAE